LFATVAPEKLASRELDASVGASGPHDFAVRKHTLSSVAWFASTASRPNVRDDGQRPSVGQDDSFLLLFLPGRQAKFGNSEIGERASASRQGKEQKNFWNWPWTGHLANGPSGKPAKVKPVSSCRMIRGSGWALESRPNRCRQNRTTGISEITPTGHVADVPKSTRMTPMRTLRSDGVQAKTRGSGSIGTAKSLGSDDRTS
jgi:hypothetical protein